MRTPTLLTGLTGIVAVLVLLYVGMTAMNLQPHITFGDPNVRVAGAGTTPSQPAGIAPTVAPPSPAATPTPTPAPAVPQSASVPLATPNQPEGKDSPAAPVGSPPVSAVPPPAAAPQAAPPVPAAANAEALPSSLPAVPPAITPAPSPPPVAAATSPEPKPAAADSPAPSPPPAAPIDEVTPAANEKQPAPAERLGRSEIATSAEPPTSDAGAAISERMAPQSPASPKPPLMASVPTPTARPVQNASDDPEATTSAKPLASDGKKGKADEAGQGKAGQDKAGRGDAGQGDAGQGEARLSSPDTKAPPMETAALTPQPEKPDEGAPAAEQPNAGLKPVDLSRPLAERAGILTVGGRSIQLAGIVPTDPERSCTGPNGKEWPCGTLARTALRSFLLGRTITCDVPDPAWKGAVTADCRFAKLSIGDWLARNGWAEVASGSQFSAAADEARKAGRGVYGNDPRKKHESTLAPEPPKDDPLNPI